MITLDKTTGMGMGTETPTMTTPSTFIYQGHQEGLRANDLVTLHSLLVCNALAGNIGLSIRTTVTPWEAETIDSVTECDDDPYPLGSMANGTDGGLTDY